MADVGRQPRPPPQAVSSPGTSGASEPGPVPTPRVFRRCAATMAAAPAATVAVPTPRASHVPWPPVTGNCPAPALACPAATARTGGRTGTPRAGGTVRVGLLVGEELGTTGGFSTPPTSGGFSTGGRSGGRSGGRTTGGGADAACADVMETTCTAGATHTRLAATAAPRSVVRLSSTWCGWCPGSLPDSSLFIWLPLLSASAASAAPAVYVARLGFGPFPRLSSLPRGWVPLTLPGGPDAACALVIERTCTAGATHTTAVPTAAPRRAALRLTSGVSYLSPMGVPFRLDDQRRKPDGAP